MSNDHTPSTEDIELVVLAQLKQTAERHGFPHDIEADRADFRRWLSTVEAAAEQRGAEQGWNEALELLENNSEIGTGDLEYYKEVSPYRADRLEGGDREA